MANPQKENGYTAIANEIMEALYSSSLNATQLRILLVVFRYTYGFNRKNHALSVGFISKATGISKRYISSELKKLTEYKILEIKKEHTDTESREISFNKYYDRWSIVPQVKNCSSGEEISSTPDEVLFTTTDEELFIPPDEELFIQESKYKAKLKANNKTNKELIEEYTNNQDLIQALLDFIDTRKQLKKPMTERALKLCFKELDKNTSDDNVKIQMVEQSIMRGWSGVFPLKEQYKNSYNYNPKTDTSKGVMHGGEIIDFNAFSKNG